MQDDLDDHEEPTIADQLHEIVDRMLSPLGKKSPRGMTTLLGGSSPPFDYKKPNEHDSKAEFLLEKEAVQEGLNFARGLFGVLTSNEEDAERTAMLGKLKAQVDQKLHRSAPRPPIADPFQLVRKNVASVGGYAATVWVILDLWAALAERMNELKGQEAKFWNVKHRAPDYYARTIALRVAKLYARETGQRPTFGTSGETGDPSTGYSRALGEIFALLGIKTAVRSPAEWAIAELTDEDLRPVGNALLRYGIVDKSHPLARSYVAITRALSEKRPEE